MTYPQSYIRAYLDSYGGLLGTRIEVIGTSGEWFVRVIEDVEERTYSFELESVRPRLRRGAEGAARASCDRSAVARPRGSSAAHRALWHCC